MCITHNSIIPLCYSQPLKKIIVYTTMKDWRWRLVTFLAVRLFIWRVSFGLGGTTPTTASSAVSSRKLFSTMEDNVENIFLFALENGMIATMLNASISNLFNRWCDLSRREWHDSNVLNPECYHRVDSDISNYSIDRFSRIVESYHDCTVELVCWRSELVNAKAAALGEDGMEKQSLVVNSTRHNCNNWKSKTSQTIPTTKEEDNACI